MTKAIKPIKLADVPKRSKGLRRSKYDRYLDAAVAMSAGQAVEMPSDLSPTPTSLYSGLTSIIGRRGLLGTLKVIIREGRVFLVKISKDEP